MQTRPRRESNSHLRFRKPPFYPLNYGDRLLRIVDFGLRIGESDLRLSRQAERGGYNKLQGDASEELIRRFPQISGFECSKERRFVSAVY